MPTDPIFIHVNASAPAMPLVDEVMVNIKTMLEMTRDLPPMPQYIAVHPDDLEAFKSLFPMNPDEPIGHWMGRPLTGVPVRTDPDVHRDTVRVRVDGKDRDFPLVMPRYFRPEDEPLS